MNNHPLPPNIAEAVAAAAAALMPSAFGATVAVALKRGVHWTERLLQIFIGVVVSYYVCLAAEELFEFGPFMDQAIAFTSGLLAYDALPRFRDRTVVLIGELPDSVRDLFARKRKGDGE